MRRLLIVLVTSIALGLVGGVGTAMAGDLLTPPSEPAVSQTATQSNDGANTANQSGTSEPVVVSGPNVAALNGGDVNQNSGNWVDASNHNTANQSNTQQNGAGQSQTVAGNGCCSSSDGASQSASQSNDGSNSADQRGYSAPIVVSGGNYAIANKDDVNQNSGNWVDASN